MCPVHRKEGGQEVWASKGPHGQDFGLEIPPDQQEYLNMADSLGTVCVSECWRGKRERERERRVQNELCCTVQFEKTN